jgi:DNA-binding transcriptional regulator PaaX
MSLRTTYGINDKAFTQITNGKTMKDTLVRSEVARLVDAGLLLCDANEASLRTTRKGLALLDYIVRAIY